MPLNPLEIQKSLLILPLLAALAIGIGDRQWRAATEDMRARLESQRTPMAAGTYAVETLAALPAPVQRWFRAVLTDGQPLIAAVDVEHRGRFNLSETGERWVAFTSSQRVVVQRPGFLWDARMSMLPGISMRVHDGYVGGEGLLRAALLGLVPVVDLHGTPELNAGELMRYLAEAAWYPTALLPGSGVEWATVDETSARATLVDGATRVSLLFRFDAQGLVESVRSEARDRTVGGVTVPMPWEGRWSEYELREGMRIPLAGEVAWLLPEGRLPYWRGRIERIEYRFAP